MEQTAFIFDMDGTLYHLDDVPGTRFGDSLFCRDLTANSKRFIGERLDIDPAESSDVFNQVMEEYSGELSIGLETSYGIDRYDLFDATWKQQPDRYIGANPELANLLAPFTGRSAILSAAPRVWVDLVLDYLGVSEVFGDQIYSGEPDLRKPNPAVFSHIASQLGREAASCLSIGDQNHSDILPAKSIGMQTALVGPEQLDADFFAETLDGVVAIIKQRRMI